VPWNQALHPGCIHQLLGRGGKAVKHAILLLLLLVVLLVLLLVLLLVVVLVVLLVRAIGLPA
jgi:hypothetical protein